MSVLAACLTGFILDLILGDPSWLYHPVRLMGSLITRTEMILRKMAGTQKQKLILAGGILCIVVIVLSTMIPMAILYAAGQVHPVLRYGVESIMCFQLLAAKSLKQESEKVYKQLKNKNIEGARNAVSMIVGRDTMHLTEEEITKAAVETVAENTSDGVVAPLLFMLLGGAPLGFAYKAINTMDSMVGYKNERYLYMGRAAARMDDVANFIPARISAVLMTAGAFLIGMDGRHAWLVFRRDRYKHASPNSAQTEAVCAGALQVQLSGNAYYFGILHKKEYIGDAIRPICCEDIKRANYLLYITAFLTVVIFGLLRYLFL